MKWPHEYDLSGSIKERTTYYQLSVTQWVCGFCRIMKEEKNNNVKEHMLDCIISLFNDANDFSWNAAKASHAVLLCNEITQRHTVPSSTTQNSKKNVTEIHLTCNYFNLSTCSRSKTHETRGILYKHICSACFAVGKSFNHPEIECR